MKWTVLTLGGLLAAAAPKLALAAPSAADPISSVRAALRESPSCAALQKLSESLAAVSPASDDALDRTSLEALREEVRLSIELCAKKKTDEAPHVTTPSTPAPPAKRKSKTTSRTSQSSMQVIDDFDRALSAHTKTCRDPDCRKQLEERGEDLLRLILVLYVRTSREDPIIPRLRGLLLASSATRDLVERLVGLAEAGKVGWDDVSRFLALVSKQYGSKLLQTLLIDPEAQKALVALLRSDKIAPADLARLVDAGVERLLTEDGSTKEQAENLRRGIEVAAALKDPVSRRALITAAEVLPTRTEQLEKVTKALDDPQSDVAKVRALVNELDRAIWDQLDTNKREIQRWNSASADPTERSRRVLPIVVLPSRSPAQGCDSFRQFADTYSRLLFSTGRFLPRPPIPLSSATFDRATLVERAKAIIYNPNDACLPRAPEDPEQSLCDAAPIGIVIVSLDTMSNRPGASWYILRLAGPPDFARPPRDSDFDSHTEHQIEEPGPLPSACETEKDKAAIDAQALRFALATSHAMAGLADPVRQAIEKGLPPSEPTRAAASSAFLFAGLPYIRDRKTPGWSRWLSSGADIAATATSVGAFIWSASLRNEYARGGSSATLADANRALDVGVGAAISVAIIRTLSGGIYWYQYGRDK